MHTTGRTSYVRCFPRASALSTARNTKHRDTADLRRRAICVSYPNRTRRGTCASCPSSASPTRTTSTRTSTPAMRTARSAGPTSSTSMRHALTPPGNCNFRFVLELVWFPRLLRSCVRCASEAFLRAAARSDISKIRRSSHVSACHLNNCPTDTPPCVVATYPIYPVGAPGHRRPARPPPSAGGRTDRREPLKTQQCALLRPLSSSSRVFSPLTFFPCAPRLLSARTPSSRHCRRRHHYPRSDLPHIRASAPPVQR